MKAATTIALLSTAALAAAQFSFDASTNKFTCDSTGPAAYCAGGSIIVRCSNGVGQPGNCNDNLAGYPPLGNNGQATCYEADPKLGNAACAKNGLVYPASGSGAATDTTPFALPATPAPSSMDGKNNTIISNNSTRPAHHHHHWSNNTVTTTTVAGPQYTAGTGYTTLVPAPAPTATPTPGSAPMRYTGAASTTGSSSTSPYWAFAAFALLALF